MKRLWTYLREHNRCHGIHQKSVHDLLLLHKTEAREFAGNTGVVEENVKTGVVDFFADYVHNFFVAVRIRQICKEEVKPGMVDVGRTDIRMKNTRISSRNLRCLFIQIPSVVLIATSQVSLTYFFYISSIIKRANSLALYTRHVDAMFCG